MQAVQLVEDITVAYFQPTMIFLDHFIDVMGRFVGGSLKCLEEIPDRFGQLRLIVLDRQDIVRALLQDGLCDIRLGTHRIDGDRTPGQRQRRQKFWNRRLLIGFGGRRPLSQDQTSASGKGADQMQGSASHLS